MTLTKKDWLDLRDILTCALDEDFVYIHAMVTERTTGVKQKILDIPPWEKV